MALWTDEEISLLRTYYEDHGAYWYDWADILPSRPSGSIYYKAKELGLCYKKRRQHVVDQSVHVCGDCMYYRESGDGHGRCYEKHAIGLFKGAPKVLGVFDASLCEHRCRKVPNERA